MKSFSTMIKTELKLSIRDMNMPIFAVIIPVIIGAIIGILYGNKPAFEGANYTFIGQSFGAIASIGICAAGTMGLPLVISDYRHKKILKRFKVTPVSPVLILFAQVVVNFLMSIISLICIYMVFAFFFDYQMEGSVMGFLAAFILVTISIFSIGMMVAAISPNIKTSNLLCMIVYFPMLIFSGATLPYEVMPKGLQRIADFMPLTQGIKLLKASSLGMLMDNMLMQIIIMIGLAVICTGIAIKFFRWE